MTSGEIQFQVLRAIDQNPNLTQRELANKLGVGQDKSNYCINALIEKVLVKMANFRHGQKELDHAYL